MIYINSRDKAEGFFIGFFLTLIIAALVWLSGVTFYRMENTVSAQGVTLLEIEKVAEMEVKVVTSDKEFFVDFSDTGEKISNYSFYDFIIPSEIKAFLTLAATSTDSVIAWLESTF